MIRQTPRHEPKCGKSQTDLNKGHTISDNGGTGVNVWFEEILYLASNKLKTRHGVEQILRRL